MLRTTPLARVRVGVSLLVLALVSAACAGEVGKYRDTVASGLEAGATPHVDPSIGPADRDSGPSDSRVEGSDDPGAAPQAAAPEAVEGAPAAPTASPAGAGTTGKAEIGVTPSQITVGLFAAKSGHFAPVGRNAPVAVQGAFDEVNEQGGIHGRQLVLKTYDDAGGDANTVVSNHRRARDAVFAYISGASITNEILSPLADRDRVPLILGNIPEELGRTLRYGFAAWPYWTTQARIMPSYIVNRLKAGGKRIGVVYEDSQTAIKAKDVFKATAARAGLEVGVEQSMRSTQATCTNEVTNLQSRGVELVVQIVNPLAAICMYRDSRTLGYRPLWTALGSTQQLNIVAVGSGGAADGVTTLGSWTTLETPAGKHYSAVMRKYQPDSDADEDDGGILMYGFAQLLLQALRETGPDLDRERFVETMETKLTGFDSGYVPPPTFGPGDRSGPQRVAEVRCCTNNRWTTIDTTWRDRF